MNRRSKTLETLLLLSLLTTSCGSMLGNSEGKSRRKNDNSDIPSDPGGQAPKVTHNNLYPSFFAAVTPGNESRIVLTITGLLDELKGNKAIDYIANKTIFVEEDGTLKGIKVSQNDETKNIPIDLVFLVDNSGSMSEEADHVAKKIAEFAAILSKSGLDLKFGVVGYGNEGVLGGQDFTNADEIDSYLNRVSATCMARNPAQAPDLCKVSGTGRTIDFVGSREAEFLSESILVNEVDKGGEENGVRAINFANELYSFRPGSQRVYLNFTDEPVGTMYGDDTSHSWKSKTDFSVDHFCKDPNPNKGVVFSVWSGSTREETQKDGRVKKVSYINESENVENPTRLSDCTGGTKVNIAADASDLDLSTFDITRALRATAKVEFLSPSPSEKHSLKVVIKNGKDGSDGALTQIDIEYHRQ